MHHKFAEQHQVDPDEAYRDAVYAEIGNALLWMFVGGVIGSLVTCAAAYVWSFYL